MVVLASLSWLLTALAWSVFTFSDSLPVEVTVLVVVELAVVELRRRALGSCS